MLSLALSGPTATVTSSPAGISCPGTCSAPFPEGALVTLSATEPGGWSGACTLFGAGCTVTMNGATSASFTSPVACNSGTPCPPGGYCVEEVSRCAVAPEGHLPMSIAVNDAANQVYGPGDLIWKGAWSYDAATGRASADAGWSGPHPVLYDDGPWYEVGAPGHEGPGSSAGDHVWGATLFVPKPGDGLQYYSYGIEDTTYAAAMQNGWIWPGSVGILAIGSSWQQGQTVEGLDLPAFGQTDLRFTLDTNDLLTGAIVWDTSRVSVKASRWGWGEVVVADDGDHGDVHAGDGVFTLMLSTVVGPGSTHPHSGLVSEGDVVSFVWFLADRAYKEVNLSCTTVGEKVEMVWVGGSLFENLPVGGSAPNGDCAVLVPGPPPGSQP